MQLPVSLTEQPATVFGSGFATPLAVRNTGTSTAYLADSTGAGVAGGVPLAPGSTIVWDARRPLYAVGAVGGTLLVYDNGGALFDAAAVASQIIEQGLAGAVAASILATGVAVVDTLVPYVPLAVQPLPANTSVDFPTAAGTTLNTTKIQSLIVSLSGIALNQGNSSYVQVQVDWYADAGATQGIATDFAYGWQFAGTYSFRAKSAFARVRVFSANSGSTTGRVSVLGSQRPVEQTTVRQPSIEAPLGWAGSVTANAITWADAVSGYASPKRLINAPVRAGRALCYIRANVVSAPARFLWVDQATGRSLAAITFAGAGTSELQAELNLPISPTHLDLLAGSIGAVEVSVTWN